MIIEHLAWSEFKLWIQTNKDLPVQYFDRGSYYAIYAIDGQIAAKAFIQKTTPESADQLEFEQDYISSLKTNSANIQQVSLTLSEDSLELAADAFTFVAGINTETTTDFLFTEPFLFRGVTFMSPNATMGDSIKVLIIDKDNVLGLGANTILNTPVKKAYVQTTNNSGPTKAEDISAAELPIAGLYLRTIYTNTSAVNPVNVYINLSLYRRKA